MAATGVLNGIGVLFVIFGLKGLPEFFESRAQITKRPDTMRIS